MSESIADLNAKKRNKNAKHSDFPVGTKVKIVTVCRDMHFWFGETGKVTANRGEGSYLGVTVKLDTPRTYEASKEWPFTAEWSMKEFNFQPEDLKLLTPKKKARKPWKCFVCRGKGTI